MLAALLLLGSAWASTLSGVRVFSGEGHARLLLLVDEPPDKVDGRASPAVGEVPARGTVTLTDTSLDSEVATQVELGGEGLVRVAVAAVGGDVIVTADLTEPRVVSVRQLDGAVLVDLQLEGFPDDPTLPEPALLEKWLMGVSLVRDAGGPPRERKLVVIDPGHGGWDHGARGLSDTREADIALQIALRCGRLMQERLGVDVVLTRDSDVFITLGDRAAVANRNDADLFVSIHANAAPGPTAWGIETYSLDTASDAGAARVAARENAIAETRGEDTSLMGKLLVAGTNRLSRELAAEVHSSVVRELRATYGEDQIRDLGSKTALFYVLVSTRMPAILFETSFLTHPGDERRLRAPHFQEATAAAIVDGVGHWLERQG